MDSKILLQDLASGVSNRTSIQKKDADNFVRNVFDIIIQYLQEDKIVKIKGLGTFKVIEVSGRDSVNVNTGERIHISGHSKISFVPDSSLRDQVNRPFADFETIIINDNVDISEMERIPEPIDDVQEESVENIDEQLVAAVPESDVTTEEPNRLSDEHPEIASTTQIIEQTVEDVIQPDVEPVPEIETESDEVTELVDEKVDLGESKVAEITEAFDVSDVIEPSSSVESLLSVETSAESNESEVIASDDNVQEGEATNSQENTSASTSEESLSAPTTEVVEKASVNEKVVYVENRPCRFCRLCFVLLTLALMALSYLAGYQRWFDGLMCCKPDTVQPTEQPQKEEPSFKEQISKTLVAESVNDSTANLETPVDVEAKTQNDRIESSEDQQKSQLDRKKEITVSQTSQTSQAVASGSGVSSQVSSKKKDSTSVPADSSYEIVGTRCNHVVKSGEGLYRLARIYYGDMNMATYIIKYNHISNPDIVTEGSVLKIPELRKR